MIAPRLLTTRQWELLEWLYACGPASEPAIADAGFASRTLRSLARLGLVAIPYGEWVVAPAGRQLLHASGRMLARPVITTEMIERASGPAERAWLASKSHERARNDDHGNALIWNDVAMAVLRSALGWPVEGDGE